MADRVLGFVAHAFAYATNAVKNGTTTVIGNAVPAMLNGTAAVANYTANTAVPAMLNGTAAFVNYTANTAVPAMLNGTAAFVNYTANTAVPAILNGTAIHALGSGAREILTVAGCAVVGVVAVTCIGLLGLQLMGFTSAGPAAGSFAASWMSSIAIGSGRVVAGSLYALLQAAAMGGGCLLGSPILLTLGAIVGALVWLIFFRA